MIDVGTNSLKLLIAEPECVDQEDAPAHGKDSLRQASHPSGGFRELHFQKATTRLGNGLWINGRIHKIDIQRTIEALESFQDAVHDHGCTAPIAFGTHALRRANNARTAIEIIRQATGIRIKVLSEWSEAQFAFLSASARYLHHLADSLLVDIGGGSTECVFASGRRIVRVLSMPLGALHLTRRFLKHDPVLPRERKRMEDHIRKVITTALPKDLVDGRGLVLVASGGSASTLQRMATHFSKPRVRSTSQPLSIEVVDRLFERCLSLPLRERKKLRGLEPDRADIIVAGFAVIRGIIQLTGSVTSLLINEGGVREGVVLELIRRHSSCTHR